MKKSAFILLACILFSCKQESKPEIYGQWMMYKVIQDGNDVTTDHNPFNERFISFNKDGSFESGGRPFGKNTGSFTFNEQAGNLYINSDQGEDDDSQWKVTIVNDTMHWQGFGSQWAEGFKMIQVKVANTD